MAKAVVLRINGQPLKNSFNELASITRKLERELRRLPVGTDEWLKKAEQVKETRSHFEKVKDEINEVRFATEKSANWFERLGKKIGSSVLNFAKGFALSNIFDGFGQRIVGSVDKLLELSDAMSGVKKTTGLATDQVKALWDEFDNIDTRTTKMELMKIAEMAGRLGIQGKEEVAEFTKEIDKAYVALGDSFSGGLEAVASKLGKIKGLFEDTVELNYASAINKVGSALNELAANGTSSEENISDFALRVGQLPNALKPSASATLGLGAAFEESGVDAQIAASGYSKFITTAAESIEPFAYSMHMTVEQAKELINTKPEEFFLRFAQGMKGLEATESAKLFDSLKLNTLEVQKAIGVAGDNTDRFTNAIKLSSKAMDEMVSLNNEFNEVNNNAAAIWKKIKNAIADVFTSGEVFNWFEGVIKLIGYFAGVTKEAQAKGVTLRDNLKTLVKWIKVLTTTIGAYMLTKRASILLTKNNITLTKLETLQIKKQSQWITFLRGATFLLSATKLALTGNIKGATVAMRSFNRVTRLNPWGLLISALTAAISYFVVFNDKVEDATEGMKNLNAEQEIAGEYAKEHSKEVESLKSKIEPLIDILKDSTTSLELRKKAYESLVAIAPEFENTVNDEYLATINLTSAYDKLIKKLDQAAMARARESVRQKRYDELAQAESERIEAEAKAREEAKENVLIRKKNKNAKANEYKGTTSYGVSYAITNIPTAEKTAAKEALQKAKKREEQARKLVDDYNNYSKKEIERLKKALVNMKKSGIWTQKEIKEVEDELYSRLGIEPTQTINKNSTPDPNKTKSSKHPKNRLPKDDLKKQIERESKEAIKEQEKWGRELVKAKNEEWDAVHAIDKEGLEKELAQVIEANRRKRQEVLKSIEEAENAKKEYEAKINKLTIQKSNIKDKDKIKEIDDAISNYKSAISSIEDIVLTHNKRLVSITEAGNKEVLKVKEDYLSKSIDRERKAFDDTLKDSRLYFERELETLDISEEEKKKRREEFRKQELIKQAEFLKQLTSRLKEGISSGDWTGLLPEDLIVSEEQKEQIADRLRALGFELTDVKEKLNGIKSGGKEGNSIGLSFEQTDLFGMSPSQWEQFLLNVKNGKIGIEEMVATVMVLRNAWGAFYDYQAKKEQENLKRYEANANRKKDALRKQLDEGYINQKEYDVRVKQIEEDVEKRQAEFAYQQAKREKENAIISSIINTALAVSTTIGKSGFLGIPLAAIVGAMGAVQTAIIASQPLPSKGYDKGGITTSLGFRDKTGHEVAGIVHADEYVIPKWLRKQPEVARVEQWLEAKRTGRDKPFFSGGNTSELMPLGMNSDSSKMKDNEINQLLMGVLLRNVELLETLEENGVKAYMVADEQAGKMMIDAQKKYNLIKYRNKK